MRRTPTALVLASLLLITACSDDGEVAATESRGSLVVWNGGAVSVLEGGEFTDVDATGTVSQVTASSDGALVWTRIERNPPSVDAVIEGEERVNIDTPTVPFFYEWSPTGERIALLGNAPSGGGLLFGLIDVAAKELTTIQSPPPFFFDWSPDGKRLIAHVGGAVLRVIDADTGEINDLRHQTGAFPAPLWTDRGIVIAAAVGPTVSAPIVPVTSQAQASEVVLVDPDDDSRATIAVVDGPVRFFASDDALALAVGASGAQRIDVIGWDGQTRATLGDGAIDLVQWSPDGSTLLWTEQEPDGSLVPMTWTDGETVEYDAFRSSSEFAAAYLPFWDQYDRTISLWSSDSGAFALPTDAGVVVHELDGTSSTHPNWEMAIWTVGSAAG